MVQRSGFFYLVLGLLFSQPLYTRAGSLLRSCFPCCYPDTPDNSVELQALGPIIRSAQDPNDAVPTNPIYRPCPNRPTGQPAWKRWAPAGGWACDQSKVDFPTVECLAADMRSCGNMDGRSTVFYSFGASTPDARPFRNTLQPQGTMFNDALDDYYFENVLRDVEKFGLTVPSRGAVLTARYAQAMASVSSGTAYLVVRSYGGDPVANRGGRPGIFQNPLSPNDGNIWIPYEFGKLQQNVGLIRCIPYSCCI